LRPNISIFLYIGRNCLCCGILSSNRKRVNWCC